MSKQSTNEDKTNENVFSISVSSKWEEVNKYLSNITIWKQAEQYDKLVAYEEFMREITKAYD